MKKLLKNLFFFFLAFMVIAAVFSAYSSGTAKSEEISIKTLIEQIEQEQVRKIEVSGDKISVELKDDRLETANKEAGETFSEMVSNYQVDPAKTKAISISIKEESGWSFWAKNILPFLIPFLLIGAFIYIMMRQVQGANSKAMMFGQSKAREASGNGKNRITFKDVAGVKEAKNELGEIVEFLKHPQKFTAMGAKIPKGVLLLGPPGVGKTLLAKAVAGEANVKFFSISGSEFVEMFVGVGASRVRDLFSKAKKNAPCIIFVDELDAVGRQRGAGLGGSHDEREQTLNQILVEMDGFDPNQGVIVLAATNRPDVLDPALLRPGRFDRRVVLDLPDINDREEILKVHAKKKPMDKKVSLRRIAERTPGFSGADLANLLNEAAILAARRDKKVIDNEEILESIEKVLLGPERKSHILSEKERSITAYHEAGHALVSHLLPNADPVRKVSIISRGRAAGYTLNMPEKDRQMRTKAEFLDELAVYVGGRVAEDIYFGSEEITTGASNDLKQATNLARRMVMDYGMSEKLVPRTFGEREEMIFLGREIHEQRNYSEHVAEKIDEEINHFLSEAIITARNIITKHKDTMEKLVGALLEKETLEQEEFEKLCGERPKKK